MRKKFHLILLIFSMVFSGCLLFSSEPPSYRTNIQIQNRSQNHMTTIIRNRLISLGWRILERRTRIGHVVAVINETSFMRDVLLMDISTNGDIKMWIRSEMKEDGHWIAPDCVCPGYTYHREESLFRELFPLQR